MRKTKRVAVYLMLVMALSTFSPVYGQQATVSEDTYQLKFIPYFWIAKMDGTGAIGPLTGPVSLSMSDVLDLSDFAASGRIEAWKGDWAIFFDALYMDLGVDFDGALGPVTVEGEVDIKLGLFEFGFAHRLLEGYLGDENDKRITFMPYSGLRYVYLKEELGLKTTIAGVGTRGQTLGGDEDYVEPFVGAGLRVDLNEKTAVIVRSDFGGFGIGSASTLTWKLFAWLDCKLSEKTFLKIGYGVLDVDYERGSGSDRIGIDVKAQGPAVGLTMLF